MSLYVLKVIKNLSFVLIILGHYCFCGYVLNEVHKSLDYRPVTEQCDENNDMSNIKNEDTLEVKLNDDKNNIDNLDNKKNNIGHNYLGIITINKIGLRQYLYDKNSIFNDVDKGIEILKSSDMPDKYLGNFILASHNGNSSIAYFHRLHELTYGDIIIINYKNSLYKYKISKIYEVQKTGKVIIDRDYNKNTITMITCKGDDKQLVVVGYLI